MEEITCSICGKREKKMFATQIKNGYLCTDCAVKADRIIEKKYEEYQYTAEQYKEIFEHPAQAQKIKYIRPKGKKCCIVCGSSKVYGKYVTNVPITVSWYQIYICRIKKNFLKGMIQTGLK